MYIHLHVTVKIKRLAQVSNSNIIWDACAIGVVGLVNDEAADSHGLRVLGRRLIQSQGSNNDLESGGGLSLKTMSGCQNLSDI